MAPETPENPESWHELCLEVDLDGKYGRLLVSKLKPSGSELLCLGMLALLPEWLRCFVLNARTWWKDLIRWNSPLCEDCLLLLLEDGGPPAEELLIAICLMRAAEEP